MAALDAFGIRYLVIGGVAVGYHAVPRYTKDLDLLISVKAPDHQKLYDCLVQFGAPTSLVKAEEFLQPDFVFHFGAPPWRVDVITSIPGVDFDVAYNSRIKIPMGNYSADCISKEWLIKAKRASGRPQDLLDLKQLEGS